MDKNLKIASTIIAIAVLVAVWVFYGRPRVAKNISSISPTPTLEITSSVVKQTLLSKAIFKFPDVIQNTAITQESLPSDFKPFIDPAATQVKLEKIVYSGGKTGYKIDFVIGQSLENSFYNFSRVSGRQWQYLPGIRAKLFAFQELENDQYELREEFLFLDTNNTRITILSLHK